VGRSRERDSGLSARRAIFASAIRLKRGTAFRGDDRSWNGDIVAPIIRDAGAMMAMMPAAAGIRLCLNGQMGKSGAPMGG
jgi:hypothetical protein